LASEQIQPATEMFYSAGLGDPFGQAGCPILMQDEGRVMTLDGRTNSPVIRRDLSIREPLVGQGPSVLPTFIRPAHLLVDFALTATGRNW
jgi:hypothetical protein